ncbi:MAG: quinolinate synthase NadA [Tannerella sp.]|nr:quinolinate synthase NadA [Tannerella sp.]
MSLNEKNYASEINRMRRQKNALILAHYYQRPEIQDIADYTGDSLALARWAEKTSADVLVVCGVHFMAETAKILSPRKKILIPDVAAGCSLAESCPADEFEAFVKAHPGYKVITYVNTTAAVKALSDVAVTSTNAHKIVTSFPREEKLIFAPDRNLGNYINSVTGREMLLWEGVCHVHERFSLERILVLRKVYPRAKLLAHPECRKPVLMTADFVGSTSALLEYTSSSSEREFIVATESGVIHKMRLRSPDKTFIAAPPEDSSCACNDCVYMKLHTMEKLYLCLRDEMPEITVEEHIRVRAVEPIMRMLELS